MSFAETADDLPGSADFQTRLTTGSAKVEDATQTAKAREKAIQSAIETALTQVFIDLIPKHQLIQQFNSFNDLSRLPSKEYISDFKVLAESMQDSTYRVLLETTLPIPPLLDQIKRTGITVELSDSLTMLLLISETHVGDLSPQYWWRDVPTVGPAVAESTLNKICSEIDDIAIIAHDVLPTDGTELLYQFGPVLNDKSALLLGELYAADLVVYGTAVSETTANQIGSLQSYSAQITLTVLETKSGDRIGTFTRSAASLSDSPSSGGYAAIETATRNISEPLITAIQSRSTSPDGPQPISLVLNGKSYMGAFLAIKRVLAEISGVRAVQPVEMQIDRATLSIDYPHSAQKLAEELILHDFQSIGIRIQSVEDRKINADCFKPTPDAPNSSSSQGKTNMDSLYEAPLAP